MNYLAHAFLSNEAEGLLVGNFIADHVKGNQIAAFPAEIIDGIYLHRKIDVFTDTHPKFRLSKRPFYNGFEKYSGVLVDIYFDHFLAKNFEQITGKDLDTFSQATYSVYQKHIEHLPERSKRFLDYVINRDIYSQYQHQEGINLVLKHLSERINVPIKLNQSEKIFIEHYQVLEENFFEFIENAKKQFLL